MKRNLNPAAIGAALAFLVVTQGGCAAQKATVPSVPAQSSAAADGKLSGKVVETMDAGGYTYLCLEKNGVKSWAAVPTMKAAVGEELTLMPGNEMPGFESKSLNRVFDKIIFSSGPERTAPVAAPPRQDPNESTTAILAGKVVETMNAAGYTYLKLEKEGKTAWSAVPTATVKVGDQVELIPGIDMGKFSSASLKRSFNNIHFSGGIKGDQAKAALPPGHPATEQAAALPQGHPATEQAAALPQGHPATEQAAAKPQAAPAAVITGKVVETMDSGGYTYVCLEQGGEKRWLAVPVMTITKGEELSFLQGSVIANFNSKTLKRTFDKITFSSGLAPK